MTNQPSQLNSQHAFIFTVVLALGLCITRQAAAQTEAPAPNPAVVNGLNTTQLVQLQRVKWVEGEFPTWRYTNEVSPVRS